MSSYAAAPDAVGMGLPPGAGGPPPDMGGLGPPPGAAGPAGPGDPGSMAMLAAALGQGPGGPADGAGLPPGLSDPGAGGGGPGAGGDQGGSDLLSGMSSTDHIRSAIKHLMMAMTESTDDQQGHGIVKGMAALHGILAGKQKSDATVTAAGGTPASG